MAEAKEKKGLNISVTSFLTAIVVLLALMILTYILTLVIPGGQYPRVTDAAGNLQVDTTGEFRSIDGGIPFWKWILSPILVLGASGSGTLLAVIAFLLVIGGIFNALDKGSLMQYMLDTITDRFGKEKYKLLALITLFFCINLLSLFSLNSSLYFCVYFGISFTSNFFSS